MDSKEFELPIEGSLSKLALLHIRAEEQPPVAPLAAAQKRTAGLKKKNTVLKKNKNK